MKASSSLPMALVEALQLFLKEIPSGICWEQANPLKHMELETDIRIANASGGHLFPVVKI